MSYNFAADTFYTKKRCITLKRSALDGKRPFCVFEPPFGGPAQRTLFVLSRLSKVIVLQPANACI